MGELLAAVRCTFNQERFLCGIAQQRCQTRGKGLRLWCGGLINRIQQRGVRKEDFGCESDIWQMVEIITRERLRREVEPIVETIAKCRQMLGEELQSPTDENHAEIQEFAGRLENMEEFFATMDGLFNLFVKAGKSGITRALTVLAKLDG